MRLYRLAISAAFGFGVIGVTNVASAAPITYDFTSGPATINLGSTEPYTVSGVTITAASGTYGNALGSPTNSPFSAGGVLVGNNRGPDEQGLGVCINNCNPSHFDDDPEIDYSGKEVVQLNISNLFASFGSFQINADSATNGELLGIFTSNSATSLGAKLADITSSQNNVSITPTGNYLYFVSDSNNGTGDVLLHSLTVTPKAVPEPVSLALLSTGLIGFGLIRRRRNTT